MKKVFILLVLTFLLTGCYNINKLTIDEIIDVSLKEEVNANTHVMGYKFYLPFSMSLSSDLNNNNILYSSKEKYYLYVDIVSYFNKVNNNYTLNNNSTYYSKTINYNGNVGYVLINKIDDRYLLEIMYNYAKIEVVTKDINSALANSLIVLKSISYNDEVIKTLIEDNGLSYDEETFNLLGPNVWTDNFLNYIEEYGTYEEEDIVDEDILDIETTN